jgi:hypothetical protein
MKLSMADVIRIFKQYIRKNHDKFSLNQNVAGIRWQAVISSLVLLFAMISCISMAAVIPAPPVHDLSSDTAVSANQTYHPLPVLPVLSEDAGIPDPVPASLEAGITGTVSAVVFIEGSGVFAIDGNGAIISQGIAGIDDASVIQSVIDRGGHIVMRKGTYILSAPLVVRSSLTLSGEGWETVLKIRDDTDINAISSTSGSETTIVMEAVLRDFCIDGNKAHNPGIFNGNGIYGNFDHCLFSRIKCENIKKTAFRLCPTTLGEDICYMNYVVHNEITGVDGHGIQWDWKMTDSYIAFNNIGSSLANIKFGGTTGRILYNHLDGDPGNPEYNILCEGGCADYTINGNIMESARKDAIRWVRPDWDGPDFIYNNAITGNRIREWGKEATDTYDGISLEGYSADKPCRGFIITGNTFEHKDEMVHPANAISLDNTDQIAIVGNDFDIARISGSYIAKYHTNSNLEIIGNTKLGENELSGNLNLPAGAMITVNATSPKRTIILSAAGGWPTVRNGCAGPVLTEMASNRQSEKTLDFDRNIQENAEWTLVMPDNYDGGEIYAIFYWMANDASGNSVIWGLQGRSYADGESLDQGWGVSREVTDNNGGKANQIRITRTSDPVRFGGTPSGGELVQCRVYRRAGDAGDTLGTDAKLIAVKLEYGTDEFSE